MSSAGARREGVVDPAPSIGALLRLAQQQARARAAQALSDHGLDDINPAYAALFQYPPIDGMRPSDLARRLGVSKQALNHILGQVEKLGYVERRSAPASRGASVHFTDRGWRVLDTIIAAMRELEAAWRLQIGERRFDDLKATLKELTGER